MSGPAKRREEDLGPSQAFGTATSTAAVSPDSATMTEMKFTKDPWFQGSQGREQQVFFIVRYSAGPKAPPCLSSIIQVTEAEEGLPPAMA